MRNNTTSIPKVRQATLGQHDHVAEESIDRRTRLMDRGDDGVPAGCQLLQALHHVQRCRAVEAGSWLVQHNQAGRGDQLAGDADALHLTTTDALHTVAIPNLCVHRFGEPKLLDDLRSPPYLCLLRHSTAQAQSCRHFNRFPDRRVRVEDFSLLDVCAAGAVICWCQLSVDAEVAGEHGALAVQQPVGQDAQQTGFPRPTGAKDDCEGARRCMARYVL
mmetsp:Transcript_11307/g.18070  ORF Transcript_11307/g.18070 Transcript_11307/m.18070 type:complete len:218 (+) Transcript_11307:1262-1915(+)